MLTWCWFCSLSLWTQNPSGSPLQPDHWQPVLLLQQLTLLITCCKSKWGSATAWTSLSAIPGYRLEDNDFYMPCVKKKLLYAHKKSSVSPHRHIRSLKQGHNYPHVCVSENIKYLNKERITVQRQSLFIFSFLTSIDTACDRYLHIIVNVQKRFRHFYGI